MDKAKIRSFEEFVNSIVTTSRKGEILLFRGQSINDPILPKIARKNPKINTGKIEMEKIRLIYPKALKSWRPLTHMK